MNNATFTKESGYPLDGVKTLFDMFVTGRRMLDNTWKILDAYDAGKFWDTVKVKLPSHQIIPDTNYIFHTKINQLNSVYAAPYIADVVALDPGDQDESRQINKLLEFSYNRLRLGEKQLEIGERAALLNVGYLQFAWDTSAKYVIETSEKETKTNITNGDLVVVPRDPFSVRLDPNFKNFQEGRAVFITTEESYENLLAKYPTCREELLALANQEKEEAKQNAGVVVVNTASPHLTGTDHLMQDITRTNLGILPVYIAYKKVPHENGGYRVDQIIYTSGDIVLEYRKGIKPNYFPLVLLYNMPPERDAYGVGLCARLLRNALAINILDSVAVTHTYAAQRTPWILDARSGLTAEGLKKDINNPDRIFTVNSGGNAKEALQRLDYPNLPANLQQVRDSLENAIEKISGIDDRYTGRDTGSVTTTGGMERMQQRVSMSDNTRISMIEKYARDLTSMMLDFYIEHGGKRYATANDGYGEKEKDVVSVDFTKYKGKNKPFLYSIHAAPLLPKSRARLAEAANIIMQVQMQYGGQIQLLTPEEWMFFQDFPQKDMILDRMKLDRLRNDHEEIASELTSFSAMTEQGMRPEAAVDTLAQERALRRQPSVMRNILQNQ